MKDIKQFIKVNEAGMIPLFSPEEKSFDDNLLRDNDVMLDITDDTLELYSNDSCATYQVVKKGRGKTKRFELKLLYVERCER